MFLGVPGNSVEADLGPVAAGGVKRSPADSTATTVPGQHTKLKDFSFLNTHSVCHPRQSEGSKELHVIGAACHGVLARHA